jgi:hypothetical protein
VVYHIKIVRRAAVFVVIDGSMCGNFSTKFVHFVSFEQAYEPLHTGKSSCARLICKGKYRIVRTKRNTLFVCLFKAFGCISENVAWNDGSANNVEKVKK